MKKLTALFLALVMALGCVCGGAAFADEAAASPAPAAPAPAETPAVQIPEGADEQIQLIFSQFGSLRQDDTDSRWSYAVTDLDHDGRLEFLAAAIQGEGRFTTARAWRVKADRTGIEELTVKVPQGGSFPDIIIDAADTFHDADTGYWYYMFNDQVTVSTKEVYANKSAIALVDTELQYFTYAYQHNEWINERMVTTFTDRQNNIITPEEYNSVGSAVFGRMDRSSTCFDWFLAADAANAGRFADSYAVFLGLKQPPKPEATDAKTPKPDSYSTFLLITKNPTDEYHSEGESALFVANAENWSTATWTFVDPSGNECSWQSFNNRFPNSSVTGGDSPSVSVSNTQVGMSRWGAYCTFYGNGQTARSTTAYFNISARQPAYGQMGGVVTEALMSTVTIALDNGSSVQLSRDICSVSGGSLQTGCYATVYYRDYPSRSNIYACNIQGSSGPSYGQMGGYVSDYLMSTVTIVLDNGDTVQLLKDICQIDGSLAYGCAATVYYRDYPSRDNIYSCYIQGSYNPPDPGYGQMGATFVGATMNGSGFNLDNGSYVTVSFSLISSYGNVTYGDSATVYYSGGYPSSDTIYHVDVYGTAGDQTDSDDFIIDRPVLYDPWVSVPYDDWDIPYDGGWAGSNYDDGGGWAGSNYDDDGGWAGSNYYDDSEPEELLILDF